VSRTNIRRHTPRTPWVDVLGKKQTGVTAREAYDNLGPYQVSLRDIHLRSGFDMYNKIAKHQAIVRGPTATDLKEKVFNVVGRKYRLITPEIIVNLWDEHIGRPVTSIGALDDGERFFLATQLPTIQVPGDDKRGIENTLVLISPMNGREAITGMLVPIRLICTNGMVSLGDIKETFTLKHYQNNVSQLPEWLAGVYQRNILGLEQMQDVWERMAAKMISDQELRDTLDVAFPLPEPPTEDLGAGDQDQYQRKVDSAINRRSLTRRYFLNGEGTGMDNKANKGTAYGLYSSIVELIDWGGPEGEGAKMATVRSAALGLASKKKERVLTHLAEVAA